jgi:hypothetical protein
MTKSSDEKKRDEALKRALGMPPQPHGGKIDKAPRKGSVNQSGKLKKKDGQTSRKRKPGRPSSPKKPTS